MNISTLAMMDSSTKYSPASGADLGAVAIGGAQAGRSISALHHRGSDINLASVDLNLLVALEALLERCNVTHAANAVGLSQPAMSRALSRLRGMFNDDLLVRTSAGYVRTIRGEQLHDRLPQTLDAVRELVASRTIGGTDGWQSTLRIAMPDHQALVLLTHMWDRLNNETVNTEIMVEPLMPSLLKRLESGELEMAIGQVSGASTGFFQRTLYKDGYACLLRRDHPLAGEVLTPERYYDLRHAVIAPVHDVERDFVTDVLAHVPHKNRCVLSQNTIGMAMAVAESDMILTVPRRVATKLATLLPLQLVDLPIEVDPYEVVLLWHERTHKSTEHAWIRSRIAEVAQSDAINEVRSLES